VLVSLALFFVCFYFLLLWETSILGCDYDGAFDSCHSFGRRRTVGVYGGGDVLCLEDWELKRKSRLDIGGLV